MEVAGGKTEQGVVVGNTYDKYGSRNPLVQRIMRGFEISLTDLVRRANPVSIHEIGCGEGYWSLRWAKQGLDVRGSDFSVTVIRMAREEAQARGLPAEMFEQQSVYDLQPDRHAADLIVCCEVLEHLEEPEAALDVIRGLARRNAILSVPMEPVWSLANLARGKYWKDFGNTPGHIQRWSRGAFVDLVSRYFAIEEVRTPFPWTMLLCRQSSRR